MSETDLQKELERQLDDIEKLLKTDLDSVLDNVIDIEAFMNYQNKELVGFEICITTGSPNVYLYYDRGICKLLGYWGFSEAERNIDTEICETVLEYLSE